MSLERESPDIDDQAGRDRWEGIGFDVEPDAPGPPPPAAGTTYFFGSAQDHRPPIGDRARRSAVVASVDHPIAHGNWLPIGPRNLAGRTKALVVTPGRPTQWYAGTASGGVHRSTDRGITWTRVWHTEPSLAIGALAVAAGADAAHDRVYVATGEILQTPGQGIWVSNDSGAPGSFRPGNPAPPNDVWAGGFDAIAVDPTNRDHAWCVGVNGAFRTINGGQDWTQLDPGVYWSDARFAADGRLFLARGGRFDSGAVATGRALVVRLAAPTTATAPDLVAAANVSTLPEPLSVDAMPWPARVKIAIAPSAPNTIYARVVDDRGRHVGIQRTTRANQPTSDFQWKRLADHDDFFTQKQGLTDLCITVHPTQPGVVATGMVDLYVSRNATDDPKTVTWLQAMAWELNDAGVRAQHADHHQLVAIDDELWVADDGGVSMCPNWRTGTAVSTSLPQEATAFRWESRDDGISASQLYDINASPLLPGVTAGGFQDNGTHLTAASQTWRYAFGGDGGFASFDPDDPYTMLVTTQEGIDRLRFPAHQDRQVPDEQPPGRPDQTRGLVGGFRPDDVAVFVADTARHPTDRARVLHARSGRLYGTRAGSGELWRIEPVGRGLEVRVSRPAIGGGRLVVTLADTPGAHRLGLVPGTFETSRDDDPLFDRRPDPLVVPFVSHLPAPYDLRVGDQVRFTIVGDPGPHVITFAAGSATDLTRATLVEVIAVLSTAGAPHGIEALPRFWGRPGGIELVTTTTGAASSITLSGTALATADVGPTLLHGLSRLGVNAGTYKGAADQPASLTLGARSFGREDQLVERAFPGGAQTLGVSVDGGPVRSITIGPPAFPAPESITAPELAAALSTALSADPVRVVATTRVKSVVLTAAPGRAVGVTGTAADRIGIPPVPSAQVTLTPDPYRALHLGQHRRNRNSIDLTPPDPATPLTMTITDGAASAVVTFDGSGIASLRAVTVEEVHRLVAAALAAAAPAVAVTAALGSYTARGTAEELAFSSAAPGHVWLGGTDGLVARSTDDGQTWAVLGAGVLDRAEARVEALALHPTDATIAYVGHWSPTDRPAHHAMVHRTGDGGQSWHPVGIVQDGHAVAVRALELHPVDPRVVFAGTDQGVFWSRDEGATWTPFSHGLPGCRIIDLAVDPDAPALVAATWGAGAYRREIGSAPGADVRLHLRASELDRNGSRPVRTDPDPFALTAEAHRPQSPDIRVTRGIVPAVTDGVRVDLDLADEDVVGGSPATVVVQVHNRGALPARSGPNAPDPKVRVVILATDVVDEPPDLPADFWMTYRAGPLGAALGAWRVLADVNLPAPLEAETPQVVRHDATPLVAAGPRLGVLAIVSCPDDELAGGHTTVDKLLATERRVAYTDVRVLTQAEDARLVLRSTSGQDVTVVGGANNAAGPLRITNLDAPGPSVAADPAPAAAVTYDLSAAGLSLLLRQPAGSVDLVVDNTNGEFLVPAAARPSEVVQFIARRLEVAGLPVRCVRRVDHLRLRARGGATVEVTGGSATGAGKLNFAPAGAQPSVTSASDVTLPANATIDLTVRAHGKTFARTVRIHSVAREHAQVLNAQFADLGIGGLVVAESSAGLVLVGDGVNDHTVTLHLSGPDLATFGLVAGDAPFASVALPVPVDVSAPRRITIGATRELRVRFRADAAVSPAEVRRTINTLADQAEMPVRAEPGIVQLRVGASTSDPGPARTRTGGAGLADVATSGAAPAPDPAVLFDLRSALGHDRLVAAVANTVYVRAANTGNLAPDAGRFRLYRIAFGSPVVTPHHQVTFVGNVAPGAVAPIGMLYTPTAAAGGVETVLAVVDEDADGRRLDPPPSWPTTAAFLAWVDARPGAAARRFEVAP